MVYQSSRTVYSTRSKHTGCLITVSSNTYTTEAESYCRALSHINVSMLAFNSASRIVQGTL